MANIVRKPGQIILLESLPWFIVGIGAVFGLSFIISGLLMIVATLGQLNTLNISCKKVELKIADCEFTQTPKIRLFPTTVESYTGIKDIQYFQETETTTNRKGNEVTYTSHYIIFKQASGDNKVRYSGYYAQWAVGQISNFLNSQEETLSVSSSREIGVIGTEIGFVLFSAMLVLLGIPIVSSSVFYEVIDINANIRQITEKRIGLPFYYKTISFSNVDEIAIVESEVPVVEIAVVESTDIDSENTDNDGNKLYSLEIRYRSGNKQNKILVSAGLNQEIINSLGQEISRLIGCRLILA